MTKLIWLTDLHFDPSDEVLGHDPRIRLSAALDHINRHHADAAYCVISGDLVDRATPAAYAALAERLGGLRMPVLPLVGNHDDRQLLRAALPLPDSTMPGFIQYKIDTEDAVLICLDTLKPGADAGAFCDARQTWLQDTLDQTAHRPVLIFQHHPPMTLGLPMLDPDRLEDGDAFVNRIASYPNIAHLCMGHVHRPTSGVVQGIPFSTLRSVLYQAPAPLPAWDWESFAPSAEAPELAVIHITHGRLTLQREEFCAFELGTASLRASLPDPGR